MEMKTLSILLSDSNVIMNLPYGVKNDKKTQDGQKQDTR